MNQEKADKYFATCLGQQLNEFYATSDDAVFVSYNDAVWYCENVLKNEEEIKNITLWYRSDDFYGIGKWVEINSEVKTFMFGDEPELIHVIKTGFEDKYMVVWEDAYELNIGKTTFGTKAEIQEKYNIIL